MAQDYRDKYLEIEREFNYFKHTYQLDIEKQSREFEKMNEHLNERIEFEIQNSEISKEMIRKERDAKIDEMIIDNRQLVAKINSLEEELA